MMKRIFAAAAAIGLLVSFTGTGRAQTGQPQSAVTDMQNLAGLVESLQAEMGRMRQTIEEQNRRIQALETVRVVEKGVPETRLEVSTKPLEAEEKKVLSQRIGEAVPWLSGAKFGGDFRLRQEYFDATNKDDSQGPTGTANDRSRNRFRMRLRWGFQKDFSDGWQFGFRLVTGSTTDQTGTNATLGNPGYFNFKSFQIDKAYVALTPAALQNAGALRSSSFGAGKFENPFLRYSTGIVWDGDVMPEGLYEKATWRLLEGPDSKLELHGTAGQFIVNENAASESDAQIFGYQGALGITRGPLETSAALSYYDYTNWFQTVTSNSAGTSYLRTNSIVADNFRVLDVYPEAAFPLFGKRAAVWADFAKNLANVGTEDAAQSGGDGIHDSDDAWGVGFKFGSSKKKGEWELLYGYYEIGANAVVAAFNDSDFGGPGYVGFTNRMGHKIGLTHRLSDTMTAGLTLYFVEPLTPSTRVASSPNESVFRSQADLSYQF